MANPVYWPSDELNAAKADAAQQSITDKLAAFARQYTPQQPPSQPVQQPALPSLSLDRNAFMPWLEDTARTAANTVTQGVQQATSALPSLDDVSAWMPWKEKPQPQPVQQPQTETAPGTSLPTPAGGTPAPMPSATQPTMAKGEIDNSSRESFVRTAYPYALEAADGDPKLANQLLATAISENGAVGTGRDLGKAMGFNVGGIQGIDGPAGSFMALDAGRPRQFAAYNNLAEGFRGVRNLVSGGRYAQAAANYQQTGDIDRYWREVNQAGYSESPQWDQNIGNIRRNQVEPLTAGLGAVQSPVASPQMPTAQPQRPQAASGTPQAMPQASSGNWGEYTPNDLTPNQFTEGQAIGLSWDAAAATCGIAAAVAFARANGRNPTFQEAKELAERQGEWNPEVGMTRGSVGEVALLKGLNVDARIVPLSEQTIASEVQAGRPVQINAHGSGGHFYVATAYDPQTRKFNFGNSAAILKRSGGNTWYRLDELPALGVGTPSEAIVLGAT